MNTAHPPREGSFAARPAAQATAQAHSQADASTCSTLRLPAPTRRLQGGTGLWLCAASLGAATLLSPCEASTAWPFSTQAPSQSAFLGALAGASFSSQLSGEEPEARWVALAGTEQASSSDALFLTQEALPRVSAVAQPTPSRARFLQAPLSPTAAPEAKDATPFAHAAGPRAERRLAARSIPKASPRRAPKATRPASVADLRAKSQGAKKTQLASAAPVQVLAGTQDREKFAQQAEQKAAQAQAARKPVTISVADLPAADSAAPIAADMLPELASAAQAAQGSSQAPVSAPEAEQAVEKLASTRRVIQVSALKLPAAGALPEKYRSRAVSADTLAPTGGRVAQATGRRAQNISPSQPGQPVTSSDRLPNQIEVSVSTFVVLLTTTDLQTVAVADPAIADVAVVNSRSVLVNGKAPGVTSLVVVDRNKIRQYQVRVTAAPGRSPGEIAGQIGVPGVTARQAGDSLVLEGEVGTAEESRRAAEVAGAYSPKVINQLVVRELQGNENSLSSQIQSTIDLPNVRVRAVNDTVFLDGTVETQAEYARAETIARALSKNVVNLITLPRITIDQAREAITGSVTPTLPSLQVPAPLTVRQVGDQILLSGAVPNQAAIEQAVASAGRTGLQVVNQLSLAAAPTAGDALTLAVQQAIGRPGVTVSGSAKRLILQGTVPDSNAAVTAVQIARAFAVEVDNMLQVSNPIQVNVEVSFVEITNTAARNLGVTAGSASLLTENIVNTPATVVPGSTGSAPIIVQGTTNREITIDPTLRQGIFGFGQSISGAIRNLDPFRARIDALYANNNARLLSNPKTTVISGRTATFQVGGQVPIPALSTANQAGTTTGIVFKDYGILLDVTPIANPDGVTTMRVRAEVSAPDFTTGVTPAGGGSPIPGFTRRSTVTELTFKPGSTLALSGLVQNNVTREQSRIPVISRIPILGELFKSKRFQRNETELVIFVKPTVFTNILANGQTAPGGVVASDNTVNTGTVLGNPGIASFNNGAIFQSAGSGGAAGGGAGN